MDSVSKAIDKMSTKNKKLALYTFLEVVAVLIMCFVGGCFDWMHLKFTFDKFGEWSFYETVLQKWTLYSCALLVGYFFKLEREELNNEIYLSTLGMYRELLKSKKESFVFFIESIFNPATKKRYIKMKAEYKLLKLDKKAKDEWKIEFNKALKSEKGLKAWTWMSEESGRYARERIKLTELASDNYINENWEVISIKYPSISPHIFTPSLRKNITPDEEYKVENETAKDMGRTVVRKLITVFLVSVIFAMFILQPSANELLEQANGWLIMIIQYIIRVIMIIVNFIFGLYTGKEVFENNFILPIDNRIRILKQYINWKKENNEKDSWADQVIDSYNRNVELKIQLEEAVKAAEEKQLK